MVDIVGSDLTFDWLNRCLQIKMSIAGKKTDERKMVLAEKHKAWISFFFYKNDGLDRECEFFFLELSLRNYWILVKRGFQFFF